MKNIALTYSPYSLKFKKPFSTAKGIIIERKGILINLIAETKYKGIGDVAPFPEFGSESYDDAIKFLDNFKLNLKVDLDNIYKSIDENLSSLNNLPALRHGLEQALLNLVCRERKTTLNKLLSVTSKKELNVNAVIGFLSPAETAERSKELVGNGFLTLKIKVGRDDFEEDLNCISSIRQTIRSGVKLRIDANGKWTLSQAKDNLKRLEKFNIEYVEQPVKNIDDFVELSKHTSIPLAADESLRTFDDALNIIKKKSADVLIIKPMMLGGITPVIKIIELAGIHNVKTIITSSFESSIGRSLAVFAASLIGDNSAHGLATSDYFEKDIATDPFPVIGGKIILSKD